MSVAEDFERPALRLVAKPVIASDRNVFQVLLRVQNLHASVRAWLAQAKPADLEAETANALLPAIQGLARAAQAEGFAGYASVCLRVAERIEPLLRQRHVPRAMLTLVSTWLTNSDVYLRRPSAEHRVLVLIRQLGACEWGSSLSSLEQEHLLKELMDTGRHPTRS